MSAPNVADVLVKAVQEILKDPSRAVKDIDLFSSRDLEQLQVWNQPFPQKVDACVHDLVLEHAKVSPQGPALCSWDGDLNYQDLEDLSCRLASDLIDAGVRQETIVPVCFKKSLYAVVAMVAILRAGGAFVPLDPSHPEDRVRAVIEKANASIAVASPDTAPLFHNIPVAVFQVSSTTFESPGAALNRSLPLIRPGHAAFVLFTSGSTGKPKGIVQEHASVCTSSIAHGRAMHVTSKSRVFQYAAFTFDVSMMDIFTTLIHGGCVCIPSEEDRMGSFTSAMNRMGVNWVLFTPSVASLLSPEDVPTLRTLVYGGEAVKQENVSRWVGKVSLFNCYGPAECGACAIGQFTRPDSRPANVGRQFGGELCWVVDAENHDRLVPIGAVGELVVEGPTLARGYLDDLAKTQAAFVKSPQWPVGACPKKVRRIYKTGDLVRQNSDGTFDFVGRKDLQVKIRGQRVEIGEVEHHLSTYEGLALSMVTRPQSGPYAQNLVGLVQLNLPKGIPQTQDHGMYYLPSEHFATANFDRGKLLHFLKTKLPSYMVPTHILVVTKLPLSVSGKIDRKIVDTWLNHTSRPVEPINTSLSLKNMLPNDDSIARELCSKVLSMVTEPGSAFFSSLDGTDFLLAAVGLDSIKVISLVMFIRQRFGVKIHLDVLMDPKGTIRSIGKSVASILTNGKAAPVGPRPEFMDLFQEYKYRTSVGGRQRSTASINVFLTGATGFLGSRTLSQLCRHPNVQRVIAHVRSKDTQEAFQRIVQSAKAAAWWSDDYLGKMEAWAGDLAKSRLGLGTDEWKRLCGYGSPKERITAIVHNGATVNWNASFSALKATNVDSTMELLRAASESAAVSEFVFVSGGQRLRVEADKDVDVAEEVAQSNGYAQTKFLSEVLVKEYAHAVASCRQRVSIIKPGYIIGGREDGIAVADDFIWRLTAACVSIKSYNAEDADSWLFVSDVDRVATAITDSCCTDDEKQTKRKANVVKILDGLAVSEFWDIVRDEMGCVMRPLKIDSWAKRLYADIDAQGEKHTLWPLLQTVEEGQGKLGARCGPQEVREEDRYRIRTAIRRNIGYLKKSGYLQKPNDPTLVKEKKTAMRLTRTPYTVSA